MSFMPLGSGAEVSKLEEELISCRLSEVDTLARLQECQERVRDVEHQNKSSRLQLSRQDAMVIKLQVYSCNRNCYCKFTVTLFFRRRLNNRKGDIKNCKLSYGNQRSRWSTWKES